MIQLKIKAKNVVISNRDIIAGINNMPTKDRVLIIEGITKMNTVSRQKWSFATAKKLLLDSELNEHDLFALLSECNIMATRLKKKIRKL